MQGMSVCNIRRKFVPFKLSVQLPKIIVDSLLQLSQIIELVA